MFAKILKFSFPVTFLCVITTVRLWYSYVLFL
jgi:hypothetical protein